MSASCRTVAGTTNITVTVTAMDTLAIMIPTTVTMLSLQPDGKSEYGRCSC